MSIELIRSIKIKPGMVSPHVRFLLQGVKCSAEIGAWGESASPTMLSFSSTLGFLHRAG